MQRRDFLTTAALALAPRTVAGQDNPAAGGAVPAHFDVRAYGATGNGKTKDTAAIQRAVDACAAAGGGVVYLSPGTYLSFYCEDVNGLRVERLEATAPVNAQPLMRLVDVRDALVSGCSAPVLSGAAVEVAGAESAGVRLVGNDFTRAAKPLDVVGPASRPVVLP